LQITAHLFARYREVAGHEQWTLAVPPGTTIDTLWPHLAEALPGLAAVEGLVAYSGWAVNGRWARPGTALHDGDEVALLPPVSGG
jgi:molybdopterin converting factor small subunit